MRTKFKVFCTLLCVLFSQVLLAQESEITGTVTDNNNLPLPGVNVVIKNTSTGTQTDFDGNYSITAQQGDILVFSYVGLKTTEYTVSNNTTIDVVLEADSSELDEVVITALGIKREKKSLGYATQEVDGSAVSDVPTTNFANALSGKVAGLRINPSGTMGGSTNTVIRGNSSLTGNNQALYVIDGTPIDNSNNNTSTQMSGGGGYDYGNAATDINPEDIESINVLKGAAATALYGARASNGVIIIETKKGKKNTDIGVTISSTLMATSVNKKTLPIYQKEYGAGYGPYYDSDDGYFNLADIDGDGIPDKTTPFTEDASFGAAFDGQPIYQWNSIYPQLDTYQQATPWEAAENDPNTIWEGGTTAINSVALSGGTDKSTYRMSFTNFLQDGNLPNSEIKRNTLKFSGSHEFTDKLEVSSNISYTKTDGKGRYGTGYDSNNIMQQFRQWWQVNVDIEEQKQAYLATGENITWNPNGPSNLSPIYSDNPYWTFYENFETDTRNRYFGNVNLNYELNDIFSVLGRFTFDTYDELREERNNVGSAGVSGYSRYNNRTSEYNYDIILNVNKDLSDDLNLDGNLGWNLRRNGYSSILASTNGGLAIPGLYALTNTISPLEAPDEYDATKMLYGVYARASLGFLDTYYLEGTLRRDKSSTLPTDNNVFYYPSVSTSILLSNIVDTDWLSFAKLRANYAEVGNDTDPYRLVNTYNVSLPFNSSGNASNPSTLNNPDLKPERSKNYELGLEANFLNNRLGFDVSYYNNRTEDQITPVPTSDATGYSARILNAGTIENKGIEVLFRANPIKTKDFSWDLSVNWSRNRSEVVELTEGIENLELASLQGGVSINAAPGEAYGAIRGSDYVYNSEGRKIVGDNGYYLISDTNNEIIGNIQPDWIGGVQNSLSYKNISMSFLIDVQQGGDIFSLDTWYGFATGLYDRTVGTNELGNPIRNAVTGGTDSGGIILPGVTEGGAENTTRASFNTYANPYGYARDANKGHIYDASYVKLREVSLTYNFTEKALEKTFITNASISLIGRNLWIIHKNIPYSDPEAGLSSGNIQGYQSGAYPSFREIGASLRLNF
ncbi:TonB-linked outer membrane protein, SusC/RagA family [Mesonia phycicola]|uniref:TonB-linked outer membrane protein, SusC/RagA family n=1 Tax=Mesonia phycicola TaxID=579105 RepID=A0A1M6C098_9FLAO|nr:SusC/RagA family TonB-linked outer membrane protein [Mesonia phycicola]SHI54108.1 TonB-linked outer membrane protein, SusC/RagA family [Mesonia phycicola]